MTKLSQLLAVEQGVKDRTQTQMSILDHVAGKPTMWLGISKTYRPKDEEGDQLPAESTLVQASATDYLLAARTVLTRLYDVIATKEATNSRTGADVVVDGRVILTDVKAPTLLFLEKQLAEFRKKLDAIPTLSLDAQWEYDEEAGLWQTLPLDSTRSKKVPKNHVKYEATKEHPAQVEIFTDDIIVGIWTTRAMSGGLSRSRKTELLARLDALADAVKAARQVANQVEVTDVEIGKKIFDFVLA